jgi:hypothetical protein
MPLFIEVPLPRQESELSCICVLGVSILPLSTIFPLHFGAVSTVWYFLFLFAHLKGTSIKSGMVKLVLRVNNYKSSNN